MIENELWLLRDNFVGECLRNQISLWQFDTQKPAFHLQLKSPWSHQLGWPRQELFDSNNWVLLLLLQFILC